MSNTNEIVISCTSIINDDVTACMNSWVENRLRILAALMPNGAFLNGHTDEMDSCDAIVMLLDGTVCPVSKGTTQTLNPLKIITTKDESQTQMAYLLTNASGANNYLGIYDMQEGVEYYNSNTLKSAEIIPSFGRYVIIGYHEFTKE